MLSSLKKMRGDKKGWYKVSDLRPGVEIAVQKDEHNAQATSGTGMADFDGSVESPSIFWDEITSITPVGREQVYDIEVEGTHNFVGNGIFAHNTYVLRANTMLAVEGEINAGSFVIPIGGQASTTTAEIPASVLTADGLGVDLYKLSTYNLAVTTALAAKIEEENVRVTSLESRVDALESGAISSAGATSSLSLSTTSLANVLNSFGVLIQKGIAQFNTLVFRQLVASKDADGTSSAGSVIVLTGNTVAQVTNSLVLPSTKVFVTFNSQITGSWWVSDKTAGSFRVVLSQAETSDVSFDYFLVQTEGQLATSTPQNIVDSMSYIGNSNTNDTTPPVITLLGDNPVHLSIGGAYVEPGITVTDDIDSAPVYVTFVDGVQQETSGMDTSSQTTHIITYSAVDAKGNGVTATRAVIVGSTSLTTGDASSSDSGSQTSNTDSGSLTSSDTTAPVVTLVGDAALQIEEGQTFTDTGATAVDDVDGNLTTVISGSVDTATFGSYTLTYTATDTAGNVGSVSRLVTVVATTTTP